MGWFDFLKKKHEPVRKDAESIKDGILKEQDDMINRAKALIRDTSTTLDAQIEILAAVDLSTKKADDRVRMIVRKSADDFIDHLKRFMDNISQIDTEEIGAFLHEIDTEIEEFGKRSIKSYEKARYLIGDEIGNITKTIASFSKGRDDLKKESSHIIGTIRKLKRINELKDSSEQIISEMSNIEDDIREMEKEKDEAEKRLNSIAEDRQKTLSSEAYKDILDKRNELKESQRKLSSEVNKIREDIDLKELAKKFHSNRKDMDMIKSYRSDFHSSFMRELGADIAQIAKLDKERISEIRTIHKSMIDIEKGIPDIDPIEELDIHKKNIGNRIHDIEKTIAKMQDKLEKKKELISETQKHIEEEKIIYI